MTNAMIEHVNLTVYDIDKTADLLCTLFDWKVRWRGESALGGETIHVGGDNSYLAIYRTADPADYPGKAVKERESLNHIGVVVEDLDDVEERVLNAGLKSFSHDDYEPGRRFYFLDYDDIEYEVVSYQDKAD